MCGMVRAAIAKPAGPTVSWPTIPWRCAVASSRTRRSMPPTRMLVNTKSAPVDALVDRPAQRDARAARTSAPATPPMIARRSLIGVVERDLVDRQIGVRQAADEQRRAHAGAADDGDFHGRSLAHGSSRRRGRPMSPPAASVDRAPTKLPIRRHSRGGRPPSRATEEAAVERVAGPGRIHGPHSGRRRRQVPGRRDPPAAAPAQLDDRVARGAAPVGDRRRAPPRARIHRRLRFVEEDEIEAADEAGESALRAAAMDSIRSPTTSSTPRARSALDDAGPAGTVVAGRTRNGRGARGWRAMAAGSRGCSRSLTPLKVTKLRSRAVDSATVIACGSGGALQVDDADAARARRPSAASGAQAADHRGPHAQPRRRGRGDDRAAADGRHEARGLQLFAVPRHVREADEDQILERFADGEQIDARHAPESIVRARADRLQVGKGRSRLRHYGWSFTAPTHRDSPVPIGTCSGS